MLRNSVSLFVFPVLAAIALVAIPRTARAESFPVLTLSASRSGDTANYRVGGNSFVPGAFVQIVVTYPGGKLTPWTYASPANLPVSPGGFIDLSFSLKIPRGTQITVVATETLYDSMGRPYAISSGPIQTTI